MNVSGSISAKAVVDKHILSLLRVHRCLTFIALADSLPEYQWREVFGALKRLSTQRHVERWAHRWDCEVITLNARLSHHCTSVSSGAGDRYGHDEGTHE